MPIGSGSSFCGGASMCSTAMSLSGAVPTIVAGYVVPSLSVTLALVAACDDVEVRDDVALLIPHEARAGALRDLGDVERHPIAARREARDVDDRARELLEHVDRRLLVGAELVVGPLRDRPRLVR